MENFKNIYSDILNSKPYILYSQGDLVEGINLFSNVLQKHPHDSNIWVELGFAHLKNLDFEMSFMCFETAYKINPKILMLHVPLVFFIMNQINLKWQKNFIKGL